MKSWFAMVAVALIPVAAATGGAFAVEDAEHQGGDDQAAQGCQVGGEGGVLNPQGAIRGPDSRLGHDPGDAEGLRDPRIFLAKNDPSMGAKASWEELAAKYFQDGKVLDDTATAKNLAALQSAQKTLGLSCRSCHNLHRGKW